MVLYTTYTQLRAIILTKYMQHTTTRTTRELYDSRSASGPHSGDGEVNAIFTAAAVNDLRGVGCRLCGYGGVRPVGSGDECPLCRCSGVVVALKSSCTSASSRTGLMVDCAAADRRVSSCSEQWRRRSCEHSGGRRRSPVGRWGRKRHLRKYQSSRRRCGGGTGTRSDEVVGNGTYASIPAPAGAVVALLNVQRADRRGTVHAGVGMPGAPNGGAFGPGGWWIVRAAWNGPRASVTGGGDEH